MMNKSYVSMEERICIVTGKSYSTNSILMDRTLKESLEKTTITGWGVSPEVQEKLDDNYIALVGIDETKMNIEMGEQVTPENAYRTGDVAYIKTHVFNNIFDVPIPEQKICFVDSGVFEHLKQINNEE